LQHPATSSPGTTEGLRKVRRVSTFFRPERAPDRRGTDVQTGGSFSNTGDRHARRTDERRSLQKSWRQPRGPLQAKAGLDCEKSRSSGPLQPPVVAAAERQREVAAVVSRGGRPDLAMEALPRVTAPTLLLVGGWDTPVIELNRAAKARMTGEVELVIVPDATHLFEEPGKLDEVIRHAKSWFLKHLKDVTQREARHVRPSADLR
jgi:pimeloyl-ACP methyl ester carboxylesterase